MQDMKTVLVTGASGLIGRAICRSFCLKYRIITLDRHPHPDDGTCFKAIKADIEDEAAVKQICETYRPDVVIHCAGLAHLSLLKARQTDRYERVNSHATETLARHAAACNPDLHFVFLSSICVYGEHHDKKQITETDDCRPTNCYAKSKLSAEKRLVKLHKNNLVKKMDILRLAPVYDKDWSFNLEKRVFGPGKLCYLRFGSGQQKMSALARTNLVEFIAFRLEQTKPPRFCCIMNVCDGHAYAFNEIIQTFQKSRSQPRRTVLWVPICAVGFMVHLAGLLLPSHTIWIHSFYDKLAKDLVIDNTRMRDKVFWPRLDLQSVFLENRTLK
jgi:nucleoside-diphosphate-sugar epimerase